MRWLIYRGRLNKDGVLQYQFIQADDAVVEAIRPGPR